MKVFGSFALIAIAALPLAAADPAVRLYSHGIKLAERGDFESARAAFGILIQTYPESPLAADAKDEIDASLLLEEGRNRIKSGKCDTAQVTLHTLISVYPESSLVKQAKQEMRKAEASIPTIRSIRYENFPPVSRLEIQRQFEQREIGLAVRKPYEPRDVEEARSVLAQIIGAAVEVQTRPASRGVAITFVAGNTIRR